MDCPYFPRPVADKVTVPIATMEAIQEDIDHPNLISQYMTLEFLIIQL
jgi:hypothetical protein